MMTSISRPQVGEAIPPWRRPASMASKWQPRPSLDGGLVSLTANSSTQRVSSHLTRASAAPIIGELSKRLPSTQRRYSSEVPVSQRSTWQQRPQSAQATLSPQSEQCERSVEGNGVMADMRRLLTFY